MRDDNPTPNEVRLKRLADRYAVMLVYLDAHFGTTKPFTDEDFWMTDDCMEIRSMPEYQEKLNYLRATI